jgi:hypothetical protein
MIEKVQVYVRKSVLSLGILTCVYAQAEDALNHAIKETQPVEVLNLLENPFVKNTLNSEDKKWYIKLAHKVAQDKSIQCAQNSLDKYDLTRIALGAVAASIGVGVFYGVNGESITEDSSIEIQPHGRVLLSALGALVGAWGIQQLYRGFGKDHRYQQYIKALAVLKLLEQK